MSYTISSNDITRIVTVSSMGQSVSIDYPTDINSYSDMSDDQWSLFLTPFYIQLPKPYVKIQSVFVEPNTGVQGDLFNISWVCSNTPSVNISGTDSIDGSYPLVGNVSFKEYTTGNLSITITTNDSNPEQMSVNYNVNVNNNIVRINPLSVFNANTPYGQRLEVQ